MIIVVSGQTCTLAPLKFDPLLSLVNFYHIAIAFISGFGVQKERSGVRSSLMITDNRLHLFFLSLISCINTAFIRGIGANRVADSRRPESIINADHRLRCHTFPNRPNTLMPFSLLVGLELVGLGDSDRLEVDHCWSALR